MKKILIFTALVFCAGTSYSQVTDKVYRTSFKESFVESCVAPYKETADKQTLAYTQKFCECSADKLLNTLTKEKLGEISKMDEEKKMAEMMPVIKPCIEEFQKEMANKK